MKTALLCWAALNIARALACVARLAVRDYPRSEVFDRQDDAGIFLVRLCLAAALLWLVFA